MVERLAVAAAEITALRDNLRAAQQGAQAPYRFALAWVARRAEAHSEACGGQVEALARAALELVHGMRHTYDPARDPVAWVDALIVHAARVAAATHPARTDSHDSAGGAPYGMQERRTP